jgi:hypothetical protein
LKTATKAPTLNPQIQRMLVGTRTLREIAIYPLAFGKQLEMTDMITEALSTWFAKDEMEDGDPHNLAFAQIIMGIIKENLGKIVTLATDEDQGAELLNDLSNLQMTELAEHVLNMNYLAVVESKNVSGLLERMKNLFLSSRPSVVSASTTDTGSSTSTPAAGETGGSPTTK